MSKKRDIPAFPVVNPDQGFVVHGMSIRDYFAAAALQGCLAYSHVNPGSGNWQENSSKENLAQQCYQYADAMLKAREQD